MSQESEGWVKVSAKTSWDVEQPEQPPTLELKIELTQYTSQNQMADMLRYLPSFVDKGALHPSGIPTESCAYRGDWDDEAKEFRVYKNGEGGDRHA